MLHPQGKSKNDEINKRREKVNLGRIKGATAKEISLSLNVSVRTVERDMNFLDSQSEIWLDNLARNGMIHEWKNNLDKLKNTERALNNMIDGDIVEVKDESGRVQKKLVKPKTQVLIRMLKQRDENIALQTQLLMDGPALHAIKTHMNRVGDDDMIFKEH